MKKSLAPYVRGTQIMSDEFRVSIKVRNNLLLTAIEQSYKTVRLASEASGVAITTVYALINMRLSPMDLGKQWRISVLNLCDTIGVLPDEVFAESQYEALATNRAEFNAGMADIARLMAVKTPFQLLEEKGRSDALDSLLKTLTPREESVLRLRLFDELTLDECGKHRGVSRERIRQIEAKALRKLRHPRHKELIDELND